MPKEQAKKPVPKVLHLGKPKISAKDFENSMKKDKEGALLMEMMDKMKKDMPKSKNSSLNT